MKDAIDQPLEVGDVVAYVPAYSSSMRVGVIKKVTPKGANIGAMGSDSPGNFRTSEKFVKINVQYDIFKKEHPEAFI